MPNLIDDSNGVIMLAEPEELGPSYDDGITAAVPPVL